MRAILQASAARAMTGDVQHSASVSFEESEHAQWWWKSRKDRVKVCVAGRTPRHRRHAQSGSVR